MNFHLACGIAFLLCAAVTMVVALAGTKEVAMILLSAVVITAIATEVIWKKARHG